MRQPRVLGARRLAPAGAAALALLLAGCSSALLSIGAPPGSLPEAPRQAQQQPQPPAPTSREHQRILAAYNGAYDDPKLEGLLNQMVAKLVAASERPDVHYPQLGGDQRLRAADRAALRNARIDRAGQRHVGARLGALPRNVARDRAPRRHARGPGTPSGIGEPRRAGCAERSGNRSAGAGEIEDRARELLARAGIRGGRKRHRHGRARRL